MKLRNLMLVTMAAASLSLVGCASFTQQCNASIAYQDGMDDGMTPGMAMNSNYAAACMQGKRQTLNTAYKNGYNAGLPKRSAVAEKTHQLNDNSRD